MTLLLTEQDVRDLLDMPAALEAVEESLRRQAAGDVWSQPRRRLELPERAFLNDMTAADRQGGWFAAKLYSVAQGRARFIVPLFSGRTGELTALVEADYLGQMRTGAATGVATRWMSRADSRVVGIIGTGLQARTQLLAVTEVRKIERVRAFSRDAARRAQFCEEMTARLGLPVQPAGSGEEAVRDADIVITATNSLKPVLLGAWLRLGTHVNAMGANMAKRCELDREAVERASLIAVDSIEQSKIESGDLIQAFAGDDSRWSAVVELAAIVGAKLPDRTRHDEITLFKSNGIAAWDLAAAVKVVERAEAQGLGKRIPICEK